MKSEVKISGNRLQITRVFDAPRQLVFAWWTQAEKLQQWSGCKAATKCEIEMDFRVGGSFTQKMHIAGAGEFSFTGKYDEIVEPERISYHADFGRKMRMSGLCKVEMSAFMEARGPHGNGANHFEPPRTRPPESIARGKAEAPFAGSSRRAAEGNRPPGAANAASDAANAMPRDAIVSQLRSN